MFPHAMVNRDYNTLIIVRGLLFTEIKNTNDLVISRLKGQRWRSLKVKLCRCQERHSYRRRASTIF